MNILRNIFESYLLTVSTLHTYGNRITSKIRKTKHTILKYIQLLINKPYPPDWFKQQTKPRLFCMYFNKKYTIGKLFGSYFLAHTIAGEWETTEQHNIISLSILNFYLPKHFHQVDSSNRPYITCFCLDLNKIYIIRNIFKYISRNHRVN